jgi:hypothetical protein
MFLRGDEWGSHISATGSIRLRLQHLKGLQLLGEVFFELTEFCELGRWGLLGNIGYSSQNKTLECLVTTARTEFSIALPQRWKDA